MIYTVGEMAKKLNVPPSTLRFYDKEGLLPFVERSSGGMRMFREEDFEWLQIIGCLKQAGMKLCDIKSFIEMAMQGDSTIGERLELITAQKKRVEEEIETLNKTLATLEFKQWYYENAKQDGTTDKVRNMPLDELPKKFREVRKNLRGN
ncbi:MAG: MerR family transcriptional regulator [Acutalibacteraceae bacterium]